MNDILSEIYAQPWAILPAVLERLVQAAADGQPGAARPKPAASRAGAVAVVPVHGPIFPHSNVFTEFFGGASAAGLARMVQAAVADPEVGAVVLDIDSPGGAVSGVEELADTLYSLRGGKPIIAQANHLAASAAYWIAGMANEIVVTPSSEVGSIGVFAAHADLSGALEQAGIKVSLISAGKYKTAGNPYEPLSDDARAAIQARVNDYYDAFVKAVARGRGVSVSDVREGFGEGRVVGAREALRLGMADRIGTLDETISRMARGGPNSRARADLELRQRRLRLAGLK